MLRLVVGSTTDDLRRNPNFWRFVAVTSVTLLLLLSSHSSFSTFLLSTIPAVSLVIFTLISQFDNLRKEYFIYDLTRFGYAFLYWSRWLKELTTDRWSRVSLATLIVLVLILDEPSPKRLAAVVIIVILIAPRFAYRNGLTISLGDDLESAEGCSPEDALNRKWSTQWTASSPQKAGQSFAIEFERERYLTGIEFLYDMEIASEPKSLRFFSTKEKRKQDRIQAVRADQYKTKTVLHKFAYVVDTDMLCVEIEEPSSAHPHPWSFVFVKPVFAIRDKLQAPGYFFAVLTVLTLVVNWFYWRPGYAYREVLTTTLGVNGSPSFSVDDQYLIFDSDPSLNGRSELYLLNLLDNSVERLLRGIPGENLPAKEWHASIGSNGRIVFASTQANPVSFKTDIFIYEPSTNALTPITNDPDSTDDWPDLSPTGTELVFTSDRDGGQPQLYQLDLETDGESEARRLGDFNGGVLHPRYSPDGSMVVFAARQSPQSRWELWTIERTEAGNWLSPTPVLRLKTNIYHPEFGADNGTIYFTFDYCGAPSLGSFNLNTRKVVWLGFLWESDATISSNGDKIAFSTARDGHWNIGIARIEDLHPRPLSYIDCPAISITRVLRDMSLRLQGVEIYRPLPLGNTY